MKHFEEAVAIIERLLGPGGCPWDREQTLHSLRSSPLEEACELKEAIESGDSEHITEELGDLFFNALFLSKLAEQEELSSLEKVIAELNDKLIRRHPHVFGRGAPMADSAAVKEQWEKIKKSEATKKRRQSALDRIPRGLPIMTRASKVLQQIAKSSFSFAPIATPIPIGEEALASTLLALLYAAEEQGVDIERGLSVQLASLEGQFRHYEKECG